MKALTLWQPWAQLVALNQKRIETRGWQTNYRGLLAIHSAVKMTPGQKEILDMEPFASALTDFFATGADLPLGAMVAVCHLKAIMPTRGLLPRGGTDGFIGGVKWELTANERAFGDYSDGRFGWLLANIQPLDVPIPCKGAQGLWNVSPQILEQISKQVNLK